MRNVATKINMKILIYTLSFYETNNQRKKKKLKTRQLVSKPTYKSLKIHPKIPNLAQMGLIIENLYA